MLHNSLYTKSEPKLAMMNAENVAKFVTKRTKNLQFNKRIALLDSPMEL